MQIDDLHRRCDRWDAALETLADTYHRESLLLSAAEKDQEEIFGAIKVLQFVSEQTSKNNEEQAATLASLALSEVFQDQDLSLVIDHEVQRGQPAVSFRLKYNLDGSVVEGDPMESFGGGPALVLGLVLQVISVVRQKNLARILILDEPLVHVSKAYQEAAGKLMRKLCEPPPRGLSFKMLVVTHVDSIAAAAHRRYVATKNPNGKGMVLTLEKS
jgi:DNA repair ATPase RecN